MLNILFVTFAGIVSFAVGIGIFYLVKLIENRKFKNLLDSIDEEGLARLNAVLAKNKQQAGSYNAAQIKRHDAE